MKFIAKTFLGFEEILASELQQLRVDGLQIDNRAVKFEGDLATMYRANLWLRTASRVLREVATFKAESAEDIYQQVKAIDWQKFMRIDQTFAIKSTVYSEIFRNSQFVAYKAKDAIVDYFQELQGNRPSVSISNPEIQIDIHISHNECTVSLDSSGESLHKRGYRKSQTKAPINEALAAGIILKSGWKADCPLIDFMCGSGTILIEAAMIALNIPPGIYRKNFAFENWKDFDRTLFEDIYNDDTQDHEFEHKIYGYDLSKIALSIAKENIAAAGLTSHIVLEQRNVADFVKPEGVEKCVIVSNPPYGERLQERQLAELYQTMGDRLKHHAQGSTAWIVSSERELMKSIGLRPSYKADVLNGSLQCELWGFEIFDGKRNEFLREHGKGDRRIESSHFARQSYRRTPQGEEGERRQSDKRPFEKKSFDKKPFEKRDFDKKSFDKKPFEKRDFDRKPYDKKPSDRKPFEKRDFDKKPFDKKGSPKRDFKDKPFQKRDFKNNY